MNRYKRPIQTTPITDICSYIEGNADAIIHNLETESIEVYRFLQQEFIKGDVRDNHLFQFVFRSFYRLDNAGLSPEQKTKYFELMERWRSEPKLQLEPVLRALHAIPTLRGYNSFQFSFTTKMFNTIDHRIPIYDAEVADVFGFSKHYQGSFEQKYERYQERLQVIRKTYQKITTEELLPLSMGKFQYRFGKENMPDMKQLDFIFWSAGKYKKKLDSGKAGLQVQNDSSQLSQSVAGENR